MNPNELKSILQKVGETADFYGKSVTEVNVRGMFGTTPLHVSVTWGDLEAGKILLAAGADPNARGEHGYTPLHEAVEQGNKSFVQLLIANGASLKIRNDDGQTALALAEILDENEIKDLLAKANEGQ
jgi:uncharacterized protein